MLQAAAPVGDTIWLYSVSTSSYVTMDPSEGNWLAAKNVLSVDTNEQYIVEDAGSGNILLKSVVNSNYAKVDTDDVKKLKANTTSTTDPNVLFEWIDLGGGKIRLRNVGNGLNVRPGGAANVLRANTTETGTDTEFIWGLVGVDTFAPLPNPAAFAMAPYAIGIDTITMAAAIGSDETEPVEYYFAETSSNPGGSDSGWQTSASYTDTGLDPNMQYTYTVQMRDAVTPTANVGGASDPANATTDLLSIHDPDLDDSGFVDKSDLSILAREWMQPDCINIANMDDDCGVDEGDLTAFSSKWLSKIPNIVMIFVDDWAWNGSPVAMEDGRANSFFPLLQMPNLSQMAADGMKFQNAYAGAPQCSPSRVCLQTGMSTARTGYTLVTQTDYYDTRDQYAGLPVVSNGSDKWIDPDKTTIPEALKKHGYASAHFGKWHMYSSASDEGYIAHDGETTNNEGNTQAPGDPKLMFSITERAMDFMEEQVVAKKPFYVQISHYAMHGARECLPETRAKYQNLPEVVAYNGGETNPDNINRKGDPAVWLGMGEDLDGRIGAVMQKLEDLGIADNTYVIMVGDNGYRHNFFDELSGLPQPLHSAKWWVWDGGLRVPMIVTGPDIPAGAVSTANVIHYDFLPTFVEWAGGYPVTELPGIDGVSLASLMRGETPTAEFLNRYLYFHCPHYRSEMPASAIISGSDKLMYFYGTSVFMPAGFDPNMLFDLSTDIGEYHNITPSNPTRAQELSEELFRYLTEVGARMPIDPNPDYDPDTWENLLIEQPKYDLWGPFEGTRPAEEDE